jgi:NitT/TauT family transport system substrate-binding protein
MTQARSHSSFRILLRRAAPLLAFAMVFALAGCRSGPSANANGLYPLRLQLDWYPQPEHGGFYTAQMLGYYRDEGLDVTILPMPQYGSAAQIVSTGKAEIGLGSSDQVLEWDSNGLPLVAVAATMEHDPQAIMVHAASPVHGFADLDGHTIAAIPGATWLKYVVSRYQLHNVHEVPATLSIANFLADPQYVQQIFITSEPFFARQAGVPVRTLLISSSGYDPYRVQFTTRDFAAQHADVVQRFVHASMRGWQEYLRNPAPTNALLLKLNPALNPAQEEFTAQALREGGFITGSPSGPRVNVPGANGAGANNLDQTGQMNAARWQTSYQQLQSLGILAAPLDPATAYTLKFLPR